MKSVSAPHDGRGYGFSWDSHGVLCGTCVQSESVIPFSQEHMMYQTYVVSVPA